MKLYNLLFLIITLITLQKITAREIGFANSIYGHLFIDSQHACTLKSCRYNDAGKVYCEVYFNASEYYSNCSLDFDVPDPYCDYGYRKVQKHYRIRIDLLSVSGKCNLSKTNKFKDTRLYYTYKGKNEPAQLFANVRNEVSNGYLPSSFNTNKNLKYYFTFKTSENCTFKAYFNKINAYTP